MEEYRITILMPLKNYRLEFLKKAIESIMNQSDPHWYVLIIIEKGEYDHFKKVLDRELGDSRIEMITNEGRKLAGAINTGMRYAKTDFVAILLADDMLSSDAVEVLNEYIIRYPSIDFFHSSRVIVDERDHPISSVYKSTENFSVDDFVFGSPVKHLLCWKKDKALTFGGLDETLNNVGPDDYDFPWTMAEKGAAFKAVRECLYLYRDHRECYRLTTHLPLSVHKREIQRIMKKHGVGTFHRWKKILSARRSYLRQCLYRSSLDKRLKEKLGYDAHQGWKEKYK